MNKNENFSIRFCRVFLFNKNWRCCLENLDKTSVFVQKRKWVYCNIQQYSKFYEHCRKMKKSLKMKVFCILLEAFSLRKQDTLFFIQVKTFKILANHVSNFWKISKFPTNINFVDKTYDKALNTSKSDCPWQLFF